jgi:hypothetical protein
MHIDDLWKTALLSTGNISKKEPYPWRELKEQKKVFGRIWIIDKLVVLS